MPSGEHIPRTLVLTSPHDALLQQLAEARARHEGLDIERARRAVELDVLCSGICAVQRESADYEQALAEPVDDESLWEEEGQKP
jgi:hypothetical protein